jgi:poly(beta-D-mannuronate) lyase
MFRIWGYGRNEELGEGGAFSTIASNLFDRADGEGMEIISLKSCRNLVFRNTIVATRGGITLRGGNFNPVKEKIILSQGAQGAYGMRIAGQHHLVQSNYVSGCDYGINIYSGEFVDENLTGKYKPVPRAGTPLGRVPRYGQVKNLTLAGNVLVGNKNANLEIGGAYKAGWPESQRVLLPEACLIASNVFVHTNGGKSFIGAMPDTKAPLDRFSFKLNRYAGNLLIGGENAFAPSVN